MKRTTQLKLFYLILLAGGCAGLLQANWIYLKAELAQHLIARSWQASTLPETPVPSTGRAWPWADFAAIARLQWQEETLYVMDRATGQALAFGPGHLPQSAALGGSGRAMIAGHNDSHFSFLQHMQPGERLYLETAQQRQKTYKISTIEVVDSRAHRLQQSNADELILVTCYPFDGLLPNPPLRYVVTAQLETAPHEPIRF